MTGIARLVAVLLGVAVLLLLGISSARTYGESGWLPPRRTTPTLSHSTHIEQPTKAAVTVEAETKAHQQAIVESDPSVHGKDVVLVVGWDGNSHRDIEGIEDMVRENREEYVAYHGTPPTPNRIPLILQDTTLCGPI
jgi:hypothetical protein